MGCTMVLLADAETALRNVPYLDSRVLQNNGARVILEKLGDHCWSKRISKATSYGIGKIIFGVEKKTQSRVRQNTSSLRVMQLSRSMTNCLESVFNELNKILRFICRLMFEYTENICFNLLITNKSWDILSDFIILIQIFGVLYTSISKVEKVRYGCTLDHYTAST